MATQTMAVSGNDTTYVITGNNAATATVVATQTGVQGLVISSVTNSGNLRPDVMAMLTTLLQLLTTGLTPAATPPTM